MIDIDKILNQAIERDASDVHLICGIKPILRIRRDLLEVEGTEILTEEDMIDIYDYFVRGNLDKDKIYKETKKLDASHEFGNIRLRVNISSVDEVPVVVLRLVKNELPKYEDLGVPDIVKHIVVVLKTV